MRSFCATLYINIRRHRQVIKPKLITVKCHSSPKPIHHQHIQPQKLISSTIIPSLIIRKQSYRNTQLKAFLNPPLKYAQPLHTIATGLWQASDMSAVRIPEPIIRMFTHSSAK